LLRKNNKKGSSSSNGIGSPTNHADSNPTTPKKMKNTGGYSYDDTNNTHTNPASSSSGVDSVGEDSNPSTNYSATVMKDSPVDAVIPAKTSTEIHELMKETDMLLSRRWRVSTLVDPTRSSNSNFDCVKELLLATEDYQPHRAANRIEEHWKTKMELFGPALVDKKIALYDLSSDKSDVGVEDGYVQLLAARDLAGRAILFFQYDSILYPKQPKNFRKIMYYMMASALEDSETVRMGVTVVVWNSTPKWFDPFWNAFHKLENPYKISKLHYCQETHDTPYSIQERVEKDTDIRIHKGSLHECLHGLVTYGVPSHFIPFTPDGSVDSKEHLKWIDLRRRIESFPIHQQKGLVLVPSKEDVLMGKRKLSMHGNVYFHQTIALNVEAYHNAGGGGCNGGNNNNTPNSSEQQQRQQHQRTRDEIRMDVYNDVTSRGGRFLLQVEDGQLWEQLEVQPALHKITQAFDFLCHQYYSPKDDPSTALVNGKNPNSDLYFDLNDIFLGKQCWNLVHCRVGPSCF
jgi:hypothetical protein